MMRKHSLTILSLSILVILLVACGGPAPTNTPAPTDTPAPTEPPAPTSTPVPTLDVASLTVADLEATMVALEAELEGIRASAEGAAGEAAEGDAASKAFYVEREIEEVRALLEAAQDGNEDAGEMVSETTVLALEGDFGEAREWNLDELSALEMITATVAGPRDDDPEAEYTGISLVAVLESAGIGEAATTLVATAADGFSAEIDLTAAKECAECMLVLDETGTIRLIMPGFPSNNWVSALVSLAAE